MPFALSSYGIPSLKNYNAALKHWETASDWRNELSHRRALCSDRKRHKQIRKSIDGIISCRYHKTDVVKYYPDGSIELTPYQSLSINIFANSLLRGTGLSVDFNKRGGPFLLMNDRCWPIE